MPTYILQDIGSQRPPSIRTARSPLAAVLQEKKDRGEFIFCHVSRVGSHAEPWYYSACLNVNRITGPVGKKNERHFVTSPIDRFRYDA